MTGRITRRVLALAAIPLWFASGGVAHADGMTIATCMVLDDYPTISGVMGVARGLMEEGYTPYQAGQVLRDAVDNVCPEHRDLVLRFARAVA
jgi:hypothetical protein